MRVIRVDGPDVDSRCDAFMEAHAHAVTDLPSWRRIVGDAYGLRAHVLVALEDETIVGVLSAFEIRHPIFGHYLTTAPFGSEGGVHVESEGALDALFEAARSLTDALDADYLVIRARKPAPRGFQVDRRYATALLDLRAGADGVWKNSLTAKARNQVRRGMREGFSVETGPGQMGAFHEVFHAHMRDLGSPAHALRFYQAIALNLGDRAEFVVVRDGKALAAGALLVRVNGTAMNLHSVALKKYNRRCPNYLLYWKMIESSCARGCVEFDMGRSLVGGSHLEFKARWGSEVVGLCYNYYLRTGDELPDVDPRNPRYQIAIAAWRRMPLLLTRRLGPHLISGLA